MVDLDNPLQPKVTAEIGVPFLADPHGLAIQFRYAFVVDREGLKVLDVTKSCSAQARTGSLVPLQDARNIYVARTYAYVAGGKQGVAIVDGERPGEPRLAQLFNAGGTINDANDVKLGMVSSSLFAYVADGINGVKVVQLYSPVDNSAFSGFIPQPTPKLIATFHTHGPPWPFPRARTAIAP